MKAILARLHHQQTLTRPEAKNVLLEIGQGSYNEIQLTAFLSAYNMRLPVVEELAGFREAMLELAIDVDLGERMIDMCGTGGDGKDTINISTLASFVCAGAGIKVAKHGNYAVSSSCGSSNVLEYLGVKFTDDENLLKKQIQKANICILHAPMFHPAMKHVAPVRKAMGVKTIFNMLGPLTNPVNPSVQVVGVFSSELAGLYNAVLKDTGKDYAVIHALDGYDEISLTGDVKIFENKREHILNPANFGSETLSPNAIKGASTVSENARIFLDILEGNGTEAQDNVVIANAAMGIKIFKNISLDESLEIAKESLLSGKSLKAFNNLKHLSQ